MTEINRDRFVWIDIETFGLEVEICPILEVGVRITDVELNTIDDWSTTVWESSWYDTLATTVDPYVLEIHNKSNLWNDARAEGLKPTEAEQEMLHFLNAHGVGTGDAMCGSSVQFDRKMLEYWFEEAAAVFSYRNIDNSTIKELCARYNPRVYSLLDSTTQPRKMHRVLPDLTDTIAEARYYKDNFLWTAESE